MADYEQLPAVIEHTKSAHRRLLVSIGRLDEQSIRAASLLPTWSRAHVLTHLARNADSHVRLLEAAADRRRVEQYEGGAEGRAKEIDEGARRSAVEILDDVRSSAQRLFSTWDRLPDEAWHEEVLAIHGGQPAWFCVWSRWRETEIHHLDLAIDYRPHDWPPEFVAAVLGDVAGELERLLPSGAEVRLEATDLSFSAQTLSPNTSGEGVVAVRGRAHELLAWLLGRSAAEEAGLEVTSEGAPVPAPTLTPWG